MFNQSLHKWFVITLLNQQKGQTSALKKGRSCEPDTNSQNKMPIEFHPNKNTSLPRHWVFSFKHSKPWIINGANFTGCTVFKFFSSNAKREGSKVSRKACSKGENDNWGKTWWEQYEWCFGHLLASTIPHLFQSVYMSVLYCWGGVEWGYTLLIDIVHI